MTTCVLCELALILIMKANLAGSMSREHRWGSSLRIPRSDGCLLFIIQNCLGELPSRILQFRTSIEPVSPVECDEEPLNETCNFFYQGTNASPLNGFKMERIESILEDVLRGEAVNDDGAGCVDYSIQDQLAELGEPNPWFIALCL